MKARVRKTWNGLYYGEVYNEDYKVWKMVTNYCFTEWGAKRELKQYKKEHCPEEFEL